MERSAIKSFAIWARRHLQEQVTWARPAATHSMAGLAPSSSCMARTAGEASS